MTSRYKRIWIENRERRKAVHYFVNTFSEPSVALAVFTPPFDGKDTVRVEKP